jgi:hypothetical protein
MDVKHEIEKCTWQQRFGGAPNKISAAAAARRQEFFGGGGVVKFSAAAARRDRLRPLVQTSYEQRTWQEVNGLKGVSSHEVFFFCYNVRLRFQLTVWAIVSLTSLFQTCVIVNHLVILFVSHHSPKDEAIEQADDNQPESVM